MPLTITWGKKGTQLVSIKLHKAHGQDSPGGPCWTCIFFHLFSSFGNETNPGVRLWMIATCKKGCMLSTCGFYCDYQEQRYIKTLNWQIDALNVWSLESLFKGHSGTTWQVFHVLSDSEHSMYEHCGARVWPFSPQAIKSSFQRSSQCRHHITKLSICNKPGIANRTFSEMKIGQGFQNLFIFPFFHQAMRN